MGRKWVESEDTIIQHCDSWNELASQQDRLPGRSTRALRTRWAHWHGDQIVSRISRSKSRPPHTSEEQRLAQILSAVYRMSHDYHTHVSIDGLFEALGGGEWRRLHNMELTATGITGRDLS